MSHNLETEVIRHEIIDLSEFAKEHLHVIEEVSHIRVNEVNVNEYNTINENEYFVLYVLKGSLKINYLDEIYDLCKNQTIIIKKTNPFEITYNQSEVYECIIRGNQLHYFIKEEFKIFESRFQKKSEIFFHTLFNTLDKYEFLDEFSLSSAQLKLYSDIYVYEHEAVPIHRKTEEIKKALKFIEEYYYEDISLVDIASSCGYSEYYFSRLFKEVVNMTPYEYLIRKRLTQAKILLLSSESNIEDIAYACGFKTEGSFYKTFKKHYFTTPKGYRKMHKNK